MTRCSRSEGGKAAPASKPGDPRARAASAHENASRSSSGVTAATPFAFREAAGMAPRHPHEHGGSSGDRG